VPRANERTVVHGSGAQRGAEVRAGSRPDVETAGGVAPRHELDAADDGAERAT
jgi:hypothetical protein